MKPEAWFEREVKLIDPLLELRPGRSGTGAPGFYLIRKDRGREHWIRHIETREQHRGTLTDIARGDTRKAAEFERYLNEEAQRRGYKRRTLQQRRRDAVEDYWRRVRHANATKVYQGAPRLGESGARKTADFADEERIHRELLEHIG